LAAADGYVVHYVLDPMCSWCWAFAPAFGALDAEIGRRGDTTVRYVMGGLAPDSDQPMAQPMREHIQGIWRDIAARTGARFNHDFWIRNEPRRSTWPACRAVIAAGLVEPGAIPGMVSAIQNAYYLDARNPSDPQVLGDLAAGLGIDRQAFAAAVDGEAVRQAFAADREFARRAGIQGFPAVLAEQQRVAGKSRYCLVSAGSCPGEELVDRWRRALAALETGSAATA
jgi:putative protein-disulfide isomerase